MARKFECDRCHQQFDRSEYIGDITVPHIGKDAIGADEFHRELCFSCLKELHEFIKPHPKKDNA